MKPKSPLVAAIHLMGSVRAIFDSLRQLINRAMGLWLCLSSSHCSKWSVRGKGKLPDSLLQFLD